MTAPAIVDSPLGKLSLTLQDGRLCAIKIGGRAEIKPTTGADPLLRQLRAELDAYFTNGHAGFQVPLALQGTPFQQRVWQALLKIPPGTASTYGQLAEKLHSSPRAVGNACRANPVPIIVPCHRVIAAHGIGGYGGQTRGRRLDIKRWLLRHEGVELD